MRAIEEDLEDLKHKLESRDTIIREMTTEMHDLKSQLRNSEGQSNLEVIDMVLVKYIMKKSTSDYVLNVFNTHFIRFILGFFVTTFDILTLLET